MSLLFPRKCILCRTLLEPQETDLCHTCRIEAPEFTKSKFKLSFLAGWTALWYYKGTVRQSLLRFKFHNARSYADIYGRFLAMKLLKEDWADFDVLTYVSTGWLRLGEMWYKTCGRALKMYPVHIDREKHIFKVAAPVWYDPGRRFADQEKELRSVLTRGIRGIK